MNRTHIRIVVGVALTILASAPAAAQVLPLGISSDSVVASMVGPDERSDTIYSVARPRRIESIRFAPVGFHGFEGYLRADFDRKGRLQGYGWFPSDTTRIAGVANAPGPSPTPGAYQTLLNDLVAELGPPTKRKTSEKDGAYMAHWTTRTGSRALALLKGKMSFHHTRR